MKSIENLFFLSLLTARMSLPAQQFPTNTINAPQAIKLASRLRVGMREHDVARVLDEQNGLRSGGDVGDSNGWTRFYLLADGCFLELQMDPKEVATDGKWGGNGLLRSASIQSNQVKIISITLTNALQAAMLNSSSRADLDDFKQALIAYIDLHPGFFIGRANSEGLRNKQWVVLGSPEPERSYALEEFIIVPSKLRFQANYGVHGPEPYTYEGEFTNSTSGRLQVAAVKLTRVYRRPQPAH